MNKKTNKAMQCWPGDIILRDEQIHIFQSSNPNPKKSPRKNEIKELIKENLADSSRATRGGRLVAGRGV